MRAKHHRTLKVISTLFDNTIYLLCILLFILLPLIILQDIQYAIQTSNFLVFSITIAVLLIVLLLRWSTTSQWQFKINQPDILFILLFMYIIFNRFILVGSNIFSLKFFELCGLAVIYVILRHSYIKLVYYLFLAVLLGGLIQALYGNLQLYGYLESNHSEFKITGSFFNPGPYAGYLAAVFPLALGIVLFKTSINLISLPDNWSRLAPVFNYLPVTCVFFIVLILPSTQSRASWLAVSAAAFFLVFYRYNLFLFLKDYFRSPSRILIIVLVSLSILAVLIQGLYALKKDSVSGRQLIWKVTLNMIKDKPLSGHGFDNFRGNYMTYQAKYFQTNVKSLEGLYASDSQYAFNELLQFTAETGLIGLGLLVTLIMCLARIKAGSCKLILVSKAVIISVIVFSFFSYPSQILPIMLILIMALAIISNSATNYTLTIESPTLSRYIKNLCIAPAVIVITLVTTQLYRIYEGFKNWNTAQEHYQTKSYPVSLLYYKKAYPAISTEPRFLASYGKALYITGNYTAAIKLTRRSLLIENMPFPQITLGDSYKALKAYQEAEKSYCMAVNMLPERYYPKYVLIKLYDEMGLQQKAVFLAKQLLTQNVKVQSVAINEMTRELSNYIHLATKSTPK